MKRFTGTEKWGKVWFQKLKPRMKCLWSFICDTVDPCGVWEPNFALATFQIGEKVSEADLTHFGDRLHRLPSGKYLLVSFIEFQYGKLSEACPAHKPIFRALEKNRVSSTLLNTLLCRVQEKEEEEEKESEEEVDRGELSERGKADEPAATIYAEYPRRQGKGGALKQIRLALKSVPFDRLIERTRAYSAATAKWPEKKYIPYPEKWFRHGGWDDDPQTWEHKTEINGKSSAHDRTAADREFAATGLKTAHIPTNLL